MFNRVVSSLVIILASAGQLNMKGVFLHVLGDALGSVVVIISAVVYLTVPKICRDLVDMTTTAATDMTTPDTVISNLTANSTVENDIMTACAGEEGMPLWVNYVDPTLRYTLPTTWSAFSQSQGCWRQGFLLRALIMNRSSSYLLWRSFHSPTILYESFQ